MPNEAASRAGPRSEALGDGLSPSPLLLTPVGLRGLWGHQSAWILGLAVGHWVGQGPEGGARRGASPGLSLSGEHMAIDADCERLSAQIEEYILCVGAGVSGGLTGSWASCPVATALMPSPGVGPGVGSPLLTSGALSGPAGGAWVPGTPSLPLDLSRQ